MKRAPAGCSVWFGTCLSLEPAVRHFRQNGCIVRQNGCIVPLNSSVFVFVNVNDMEGSLRGAAGAGKYAVRGAERREIRGARRGAPRMMCFVVVFCMKLQSVCALCFRLNKKRGGGKKRFFY